MIGVNLSFLKIARGLEGIKLRSLSTTGAFEWRGYCASFLHLHDPKGPRIQIIGLRGPNTMNIIVFGP